MGILFAKQVSEHSTIYFHRDNNPNTKNNQIETTKYSWFSFFPKAIILQFLRPANLVYLISAVLQSIKIISSLNPVTAIAPFVFVITISLIRQAYEDYKRNIKDKQINDRKATILDGIKYIEIPWKQIKVGDIIKVKNQQTIPADFVLLYTSQQHNLCFVETANLDGESNLKTKFACPLQIDIQPQQLSSLKGKVIVERPNSSLHQFQGILQLEGYPEKHIGFENFMLRQTVLKNAQEIAGVVVYTGYDTKIVQNQGLIENKVSHVERKVNAIQAILLVFLFILSASAAIGFNHYHNVQHQRNKLVQYPSQVNNSSIEVILIYFSSFLMLTYLIPISLNVSIEVNKGFLGIFLSFDSKMFCKSRGKGCSINNVSIIQELGQIDYVLTDKTGTLTSNEMIFKNICVGKQSYSSTQILQKINQLKNIPEFHDFWMGLVICQDVISDTNKKEYQGSSPDQVCFVTYAKTIGYQFIKRTKNTLEFKIFGQTVIYELLRILPFDSRKKMSAVVRDVTTKKILIYTKGADSCILEKAVPSQNQQYIKANIDSYAKQGFRTLLFSYREIRREQYCKLEDEIRKIEKIKIKKLQSKQRIQRRLNELTQNFQSNLILLGGSAIQDKLQDEVPQTIERLQAAGITVMMITGDKLETAENVGYLANFIKVRSKVFKFKTGLTVQQMDKKVSDVIKYDQNCSENHITIIIQGAIISALINSSNPQYIQMFSCASSIIFCRSSPKQKASIVKFVKQKLGGITLAIGDGGNDVGMIQVANVGIGILGKQGNSASVASDFSIGQFRYLDRLVLHHGRWFYYRLSYFFVYYGWKNLIMTLLLYYFMIDSAFSAFAGLSEPFIAIYNVIIGLVLINYFAVFQQDINDDQYKPAFEFLPVFYRQTKQLNLFSYKRYFIWTIFAIIISVFLYLSTRFGIGSYYALDQYGRVGGYNHHSEALTTSLSTIIIMILISDIKMYTWFSTFFIIGLITITVTILFFIIQNYIFIAKISNYAILGRTTFRFWSVVILNIAIVYVGKMVIDVISREKGQTKVEKTIRAKKYGLHLQVNRSLSNFIHIQQICSVSQL